MSILSTVSPIVSSIVMPIGITQQAAGGGGGLPSSGLVSQLDGSVATSFYSDISKTTESTEGGAVAVWEDQSGNGGDWTQSNATYQPLAHLSNNRLYNNGSPSTSTSKHLVGPDISAWTEGSFFARLQSTSANTLGGIWGTTTWSSADSSNHWASPTQYLNCFGVNGRGEALWANITEDADDSLTVEENVTSSRLVSAYINGVQVYSTITGSALAFRSAPVLGALIRGGSIQFSIDLYVYKFCCYNRVVTSDERTAINTWLES